MSYRMITTGLTALMLSVGAAAAQDAMGAETTGPDLSGLGGAFTADVAAADGTAHGTVTVQPTPSGINVVSLALEGLPPGVLGVHLHETGLCEGPDFESAGGHLAPDGNEHGALSEGGPHLGDLPNVHVPESGSVMVEYFADGLSADVLDDADGTGFIVHANADDYESQPSGDAGGRIACGVLSAAE